MDFPLGELYSPWGSNGELKYDWAPALRHWLESLNGRIGQEKNETIAEGTSQSV
jgi:hypothetical protein